MGKFDRSRYLRLLYFMQANFSREYNVYIDKAFDPRQLLKALTFPERPEVNAILYWPKDVQKVWKDFLEGRCYSLDFWFMVYSNKSGNRYNLVIKYSYPKKEKMYPQLYAHDCPFIDSFVISTGKFLVCKHLYAVLREIDRVAEMHREIPLAKSMFIPKNSRIFEEYVSLEESNLTPYRKLEETFTLLEEYLCLSELKKVRELNYRLKYLRKV